MSRLPFVFSLCFLACSVPSAHGGFLCARFNGANRRLPVTLTCRGTTTSTFAGEHSWVVLPQTGNQAPLVTFSVGLPSNLTPGDTYTYEVGDLSLLPPDSGSGTLSAGMGALKANYVRELFGRFFDRIAQAPTTSEANLRAAAFQVTLWEIIHDGAPGSWSLSTGSFSLASPDSDLGQLAQQWLHIIQANGKADVQQFQGKYGQADLFGLRSIDPLGAAQDQIVLLAVPAPPGLVLVAIAGIGLIPALMLRHRQVRPGARSGKP